MQGFGLERLGRWGAAAIALAILSPATVGLARPPHGGPPEGPPGLGGQRLEGLVEQLGLDEPTLAAVDDLLDASRVRSRELRRALRDAHSRMRALLEADEPDEATIFAQVDVISGLQAEREKNRLGTLLRVRQLLTPHDRARLLERMRAGDHRPPPRRSPR